MPPTVPISDFVEESCEQNAITKLIRIIQTAMQCKESSGLDEKETKFASQVINKLIDAFNSTAVDILTDGEGILEQPDSSNFVTPTQKAIQALTTAAPGKVPRVHKLELVKVGVLIVVISIIMLTTCRMLFQIFARFKPEKPQLH